MGIDPMHEKCGPFYDKLKECGMVLLSHTGMEDAVDVCVDQELGNPLLLRAPLDKGVIVIAAHCASEGSAIDLDNPKKKSVLCVDLLLRLMDDEKYNDLLFADISAITGFKRIGYPLTIMLDRKDLHHRIVHGSDYPVPAINFVVHTRALAKHGYITSEERLLLNEIYFINPLLFDFVTKRILRSPNTHNTFADCVFMKNPHLPIYGDEKKEDAHHDDDGDGDSKGKTEDDKGDDEKSGSDEEQHA